MASSSRQPQTFLRSLLLACTIYNIGLDEVCRAREGTRWWAVEWFCGCRRDFRGGRGCGAKPTRRRFTVGLQGKEPRPAGPGFCPSI